MSFYEQKLDKPKETLSRYFFPSLMPKSSQVKMTSHPLWCSKPRRILKDALQSAVARPPPPGEDSHRRSFCVFATHTSHVSTPVNKTKTQLFLWSFRSTEAESRSREGETAVSSRLLGLDGCPRMKQWLGKARKQAPELKRNEWGWGERVRLGVGSI